MMSNYKYTLLAFIGMAVCALSASAAPDDLPEAITNDTVQVAYRKVDANDVLGGVSSLDIEDLQKKNFINDLNNETLNGFVPGFNGNSLWGMDGDNDGGYLVLIDGVPRDMNNVPPSEVKSITFLKWAQAVVLYGSRAAKGVIYITTKRGKEGPLKIQTRVNTGWHVAKSFPEYLGAAEYMTLYNEALVNDKNNPLYTDKEIYRTATGSSPYRYPDINMYSSEFIRKVFNRTDANMEISGGNDRARFYANINYYRFGDLVNFGEAKNNYTDRFSVRGNIDINIADWISAYVNTSSTFYGARNFHGNYWENAAGFRPNRINPLIPIDMVNPGATNALDLINNSNNIINGHFLSGTAIDATNIFADIYAKGYNKFTSRQFQFDTGINVDLGSIVKGLSFSTQFAIDYATSYNSGLTDSYATFVPVWTDANGYDEIVDVTMEGKDEHTGVENISNSSSRQTIHFSAQFKYDRTFAGVHNVNAIALLSGWQRTLTGNYHRTSSANVGFEADYNYDKRYYGTLAVAGIHSAKLAPGHRQAWSPSASLGWRVSQEDFLLDNNVVNELKLSVSTSKLHTDLDISEFYMYQPHYTNGGWYSWAAGGRVASYPRRGANENLTFITREELSVNLQGEFFNRKLGLNASAFVITNDGLIIDNSTLFPTYFSTYYPDAKFVPYLNYNKNRRTGFDFGVSFKTNINDVKLLIGANGTYYSTKAVKRDEIYEDDYQYRQGKPLDAIWGYRCLGFFATDEEAEAADQSALGGANLQAGDLKYADINGDGKIDSNDQVMLGKGGWYGDPFVLGVNLTAQWKGFTLFVHGTGGFGAKGMKDNDYFWVSGEKKYSAVVRDRWTSGTAATATYPRLTTTNGANNFKASDFWMYSRDHFNIAKVQLTYDFPATMFDRTVINGLALYVSGDNLCTISKNREILDMAIGSSPKTRFYNLGLKVTF